MIVPRDTALPAKTVLVVDDSPSQLRLMVDALTGRGYRILTAADGEEALDKASGCHPDLILLDVILPKRNGFEVCRDIRSKPGHQPRILMVSSKNQPADRFWGLRQGADEYFVKPLDLKLLAAAVDQYL